MVSFDRDPASLGAANDTAAAPNSDGENVSILPLTSRVAFCVLPICPTTHYRLSRYETALWRQAGQILFALDALDRRKPQDRGRRFRIGSRQNQPADGHDDY